MNLTIENILALRPCPDYTRERLVELFAGRQTVTLADVFAAKISHRDKVWLGLRVIPPQQCVQFAWRCAERAIRRVYDAGGGSLEWRAWAEECLRGKDRSASAAESAAVHAAWVGREDAAWAAWAAESAAWAAASAASTWAAWAAVAALDAAAAADKEERAPLAAVKVEQAAQFNDLCELAVGQSS